nr:gibberellin regulated-like protein [uncultured Prochlorococcus sp.]
MRGTFSSEKDALNISLDIGCERIHKNKERWLPYKNENNLHKYT